MKFTVTMKDPDALCDQIKEAVAEEVAALGLPEDEAQAVADTRFEKVQKVTGQWFEWDEYLRVEIDTEANTCTVQKVKG